MWADITSKRVLIGTVDRVILSRLPKDSGSETIGPLDGLLSDFSSKTVIALNILIFFINVAFGAILKELRKC